MVVRLVVARPRWVLIGALLLMVLAAMIGAPATKTLSAGGFQDPGAQSTKANQLLAEQFGQGQLSMALLVRGPTPIDSGRGREVVDELIARIRTDPGVKSVVSPWDSPDSVALGRVARNLSSAVITVWLAGDETAATAHAGELSRSVAGVRADGVEVLAGGAGAATVQMTEQMMQDLAVSEAIAMPICLAVLVWVFGGVIAALIPMAVGGLAIVGAMAVLRLVNEVTEVSMFALNVATAIGFALAVDYSLLILTRYREERASGAEAMAAVLKTCATAGRTVGYSALTVALSVASASIFPIPALRSFAYSGVAVVTLAAVSALVVVPAALLAFQRHLDADSLRAKVRSLLGRPTRDPADLEASFWYRWAKRVMRTPITFAVVVTIPLVVVGIPFLDVRLGFPDDRGLAHASPAKIVGEELRRNYSQDLTNSVPLVLPTGGAVPTTDLRDYSARLSQVDGVVVVTSPVGTFAGGHEQGAATVPSARSDAVVITVASSTAANSPAGSAILDRLHLVAQPQGSRVLVGGLEQSNRDTISAITSRLPLLLTLVAVASFVLLLLLTGSVVIPIKALLLNVLSLSATFGALVWVFQEGHLGGLGTTAWGGLLVTAPVLIFCVLFGLSMDYEVFLISRIREFWMTSNRTREANAESVALGLAGTGRVVTAAALIMSITFMGVAASQVSHLRMFGVGTTLAILVDATLIRMVLLPASMAVLGRWNWWPAGIRQFRPSGGRHRAPARGLWQPLREHG
ncbi:MMPL family transporter [Mycobacterium sp. 48b]|uniref:MMPL family transporter n=1 Tax=Mycobacterium sp. 48b TaxID=3400426 RepID=UPI003AAE3717